MTHQCGDCRFWKDCGDEHSGECRINPPIMHAQLNFRVDDLDLVDGFWPFTKSDDWCGRFSPRPLDSAEAATDGN